MAAPITAPVLQVHGALDGSMAPATAQGAERYLQGSHRWRLLEGVGHFVHEEAADTVSAEIVDFLSAPALSPFSPCRHRWRPGPRRSGWPPAPGARHRA